MKIYAPVKKSYAFMRLDQRKIQGLPFIQRILNQQPPDSRAGKVSCLHGSKIYITRIALLKRHTKALLLHNDKTRMTVWTSDNLPLKYRGSMFDQIEEPLAVAVDRTGVEFDHGSQEGMKKIFGPEQEDH
ncbi:hypothetical protein M514_04437 [Trichuris suis]|uniref:Uncharacterized protein n=1 Tax=Trichuris suis TaxID=68888 RepID=A0A085MZ36_9BILA|nr:hypothetical protein M513_04437 [Trichuris suis]KFD62482.1 hypothetical protein M514_04437 [Trichuris suis]